VPFLCLEDLNELKVSVKEQQVIAKGPIMREDVAIALDKTGKHYEHVTTYNV